MAMTNKYLGQGTQVGTSPTMQPTVPPSILTNLGLWDNPPRVHTHLSLVGGGIQRVLHEILPTTTVQVVPFLPLCALIY